MDIIITNLTPDPLTGLQRQLTFKSLNVDDNTKTLTIFWRLSVLRLDGTDSDESRDVPQKADNTMLVNMEVFAATGEIQLLHESELLDMVVPPLAKGEYDFWWWISDNHPLPIRTQIIYHGEKFAIRRGWK